MPNPPGPTEDTRAERLRELHTGDMLVLPNVWDAGSAAVVAGAGFPAVATASAAITAMLGYEDGEQAPWADREKYPAKFDIDELRCIYCGMCEEACPVDAIELTYEYDMVGLTRSEMIFDKEKLLGIYDETVGKKPM